MSKIALDPPNLTRQATAAQLGISPLTLDRWVKQGAFPPPIKLGAGRSSPTRWRQSVINMWIAERENGEVSA